MGTLARTEGPDGAPRALSRGRYRLERPSDSRPEPATASARPMTD
ncbi:hypothetical protein GCM10009605_54850 [Nocardiopsis composta]